MILVYTPSVWLETNLTTNQKLSFLDNLEGMYDEAVSYISAITHSSSYYTDAQAAARYFPKGVKTTNSVAATLDGMSADQIVAAGSPSGVIAWWSGSEASIPSGWLLCNGLNSTPDLRNRFVVGAGSHYAKGDTGGANTVTTTGSIAVAGHSLTAAEIPLHSHGTINDYYAYGKSRAYAYPGGGGVVGGCAQNNTTADSQTGNTGSGTSHDHGAAWAGTASQDKRPPFYALCYIMVS
jgi:hypothetical protein